MSGLTRARNVCLAAAAATAALGAFVTAGAANNSTHKAPYSWQAATFRPATSAGTRASAASGRYVYVSSKIVTLKGSRFTGGTLKCPSKAPHPISGQFSSSSASVLLSSSFANKNGWYTQLTNAGSTSAKVAIGTVCAP